MVDQYTLYVWESRVDGSSLFLYDLLNNQTNKVELGSGCADPYMLSEEIKKDKLFSGRSESVSIRYRGEPSPQSGLSCDVELNQKTRGYLERALDVDIDYSSFMH